MWLLYWQTEHYAGSQLDEVDLQYLAYEWERTAGTKVTLDNENIIVTSHELDVERTIDVQLLGRTCTTARHASCD